MDEQDSIERAIKIHKRMRPSIDSPRAFQRALDHLEFWIIMESLAQQELYNEKEK